MVTPSAPLSPVLTHTFFSQIRKPHFTIETTLVKVRKDFHVTKPTVSFQRPIHLFCFNPNLFPEFPILVTETLLNMRGFYENVSQLFQYHP